MVEGSVRVEGRRRRKRERRAFVNEEEDNRAESAQNAVVNGVDAQCRALEDEGHGAYGHCEVERALDAIPDQANPVASTPKHEKYCDCQARIGDT